MPEPEEKRGEMEERMAPHPVDAAGSPDGDLEPGLKAYVPLRPKQPQEGTGRSTGAHKHVKTQINLPKSGQGWRRRPPLPLLPLLPGHGAGPALPSCPPSHGQLLKGGEGNPLGEDVKGGEGNPLGEDVIASGPDPAEDGPVQGGQGANAGPASPGDQGQKRVHFPHVGLGPLGLKSKEFFYALRHYPLRELSFGHPKSVQVLFREVHPSPGCSPAASRSRTAPPAGPPPEGRPTPGAR